MTPWISFGAAWRGVRKTSLDSPLKFLMCWAGGSFLILSLVSGKQAYYLLPSIPAFALILARLATVVDGPVIRRDLSFAIAGTILLGAFPLIVNHLPALSETRLKGLIADWYSIPMMACGAVLIPFTWKRVESVVFANGTTAILFFVVFIISMKPTLWQGFDLRPLASTAALHQDQIAWYGSYHGQLNYNGGIRQVYVQENKEELAAWLTSHPDGVVVMRL